MAKKNSSAHSRLNAIDLGESNTASTPKSSPSPSKSDSSPPESSEPSSQSPPPSASPRPPKTSPPPEPSPSPPPPKLSPPPPSSPPPSSNDNSSSPTGNSPPPPRPSSSTPSPPPPSSFSASPPPPSPSSSSPPHQSVPAPSSNSSPPSGSNKSTPSPFSVSPQNVASPPTRQNSRPPPPPQTRFVPASGSGSNYQSQSSSTSHGSLSKSSGSSNSSSSGDPENTGKYIGFALAGIFFVALVAVVIVFVLKKKRKGTQYNAPYVSHDNFPMKPDGHPYVQQHGTVNVPQEGFYGSQPSHSSLGSNFKNATQIGTMHHSGTTDVGVIVSQVVFSFENILEITNGLSRENVIGEGGFGCVYKAWLPDGRIVAVKQLKAGSGQGEREFKAEVEIISRVHHRHLVSLVGYCISEQQRILVYEFVPNKTLDHHLHGSGMQVLDWAKRVKIAIGAAKGLAYLHEDCNPKIIHRDIKSANILLDDSFEAQVADFGLAKLNNDANTHVSTRVMGTFGYLAPEYATSGKLTDRSDVFSFGVVLLELITGRKPVDQTQPIGDESLVEWARPLLIRAVETGDYSQLIDPKLERNFVESEMHRMVEAAAACIRHSAPKRPRMIQVVRALDSRNELSDLSNGVKYGQSIVYDSGQYNEDIMRFRMNNSFGSSEFDMYSGEYNSKEYSGIQNSWAQASSSGESETRAFNEQSFRTQHLKVGQQT